MSKGCGDVVLDNAQGDEGAHRIVGDDDGSVVRLALVLEVADGVHDGVVALSAASDNVDRIGVLGAVLGDDVLRLLDPSCRREHEDSIKAAGSAELLQRVNQDGLVAQIEELLRLVRVPHPNPRSSRKNSSKLHVRSFSQLAAPKTPRILLHPQFYHSLKPTTVVPRQSHIEDGPRSSWVIRPTLSPIGSTASSYISDRT